MEAPDSTSILVQCREDTDTQESVWSRAPPVCGKLLKAWEIQRGDPPEKNPTKIGFLSKTGPDPLTITNLQRQHLLLVHHLNAISIAFIWRAEDGLLIVVHVFGSSLR